MRAVLPDPSGTSANPVPVLGEVPDPRPAAGEALLRVRATALNRAVFGKLVIRI